MGFTFPPFITALHCTSACYVIVRGRGDAITLQSSGKLFSLAEVCATLGCTLGYVDVSGTVTFGLTNL